jgi:DNA mismatch repair ATPase MutS
MKAHLMFRDRDFGWELEPLAMRPWAVKEMSKVLPHEEALMQDLELNTLFRAMAGGDRFLLQAAKLAIFSGLQNDVETILYRQAIFKDCLRNESVIKNIYDLAVEATSGEQRRWLGIASRFPGGILSDAVRLLQVLMDVIAKLKRVADEQAGKFESEGLTTLFKMLKAELADDYFAAVKARLKELEFRDGVLMSAELGAGNQGVSYVLRQSLQPKPNWFQRIFLRNSSAYTFHLDGRDEAGFRALSELRDEGINQVANAVAQATDHVASFFVLLRTELAFYIGCMNLRRQLDSNGLPICFPVPSQSGARKHSCVELRDACLALSMKRVVGNDLDADGKNLFVITGANQGGKSTFLRSIGLAQLMMQCGMFVTAKSFSADLCRNLFTHYKREEDATMQSGKFDEELDRMSGIVDALTTDSLLLFNESFAATNEREGAEIATQIVHALLEARVKIFFVTHIYEFAHGFWEGKMDNAIFLRAERQADGQRTFKLLPGEPLETSFGPDLYKEIFENAKQREVLTP